MSGESITHIFTCAYLTKLKIETKCFSPLAAVWHIPWTSPSFVPHTTHPLSQWSLQPPGCMCAPGGPQWQHWMHWWASGKQVQKQDKTWCHENKTTTRASDRECVLPKSFCHCATDQDEGMQDTGDAIGVVTVWVVTILPFSRRVTISRGLLLLNTSFYRQGGVTQLQAVLMCGDACQSSGPPGLIKTKYK